MDNKAVEWNNSYLNRDNFVFYPHEEIIRFVSKYITKRIGLHEFKTVHSHNTRPKILDVGCGIGRHVIYCQQMGLEAYGIDLSEEAIKVARRWASECTFSNVEKHLIQGDICKLPWEDDFFHYAVSHGVFDSMYFNIAKIAVKETARVLKKNGLFYCDLISGDDSSHAREYDGEEIVDSQHEKGTVQSYFNYNKILQFIGDEFEIIEANLIRRENIRTGNYSSRYHLILKKL